MKLLLIAILFALSIKGQSQSYVTRDIKSFGAKGDGKTNDHEAFAAAAKFFNERNGNGKLVIPAGTYLVGKQLFNKHTVLKPVYEGSTLLHFKNVQNLCIEGTGKAIIKYADGLFFGSFLPANGKASKNGSNFIKPNHAATIGNAIMITEGKNISIANLELNGNSDKLVLGGIYGDVGRQLPHSGIQLENVTGATISKMHVHHFGLDGIIIGNNTGNSKTKDGNIIMSCNFEYNARQGLSWVGGNDLLVVDSKFNHTGKGAFSSSPGAGIDIEAENSAVKGGKFIRCEMINNAGCGLVADSGPGGDCIFIDCLFWGVTSWSIWITKPGFAFEGCKFYGSIVHGYSATKQAEATSFKKCIFEDKPYLGKEVYGSYLIESNHAKRMRFEDCTMKATRKKLVWMDSAPNASEEEKYQLINCTLIYAGNNLPEGDFVSVTRGIRFKNSTFQINHPESKKKRYYFESLGMAGNVNAGGNKILLPL